MAVWFSTSQALPTPHLRLEASPRPVYHPLVTAEVKFLGNPSGFGGWLMSEITRLMAAVERGESRAAEELLPVVYNELRRLAACRLAQEKPGQTLQATALVHEAWLRLAEPTGQGWKSKAHFFGAAAEAMRRILVDNARRKQAQKRGGAAERVNVDEVDIAWRPCLTNGSWPWTRRWTGCSWRIRRQRNW